MKLELKHITTYLAAGLKIRQHGIVCNITYETYESYDDNSDEEPYIPLNRLAYLIESQDLKELSKFKLLLKPMSELTKEEIKENGLPYDQEYIDPIKEPLMCSYPMTEYLIRNLYDIYGLIEGGLAESSSSSKLEIKFNKDGKVYRRFTKQWGVSGALPVDKIPLDSLITQRDSMIDYIEVLHDKIDECIKWVEVLNRVE